MRRASPHFTALLLLGLLWVSLSASTLAQTVIEHPDTSQSLQQRWQWARQQSSDEVLIAWQFATRLDEKLHINALSAFEHGSGWNRGISIDALLAGNRRPQETFLRDRELVVLARSRDGELLDIDVLDSEDTGFWRYPLYWLGEADASASYQLAAALLDTAGHAAANRGLIQAIALHAVNERTAFLYSLFTTPQWTDYRLALLKALTQQVSPGTETLLLEIAADDSAAFQERRLCVSGLRAFDSAASLQLLLDLSASGQPAELRREAIESLAWFAPERVTTALNQLAWFDDSHRIREEAVDSLARLYNDDADTMLLAIARDHPSAATRDEALTRLQRKLF